MVETRQSKNMLYGTGKVDKLYWSYMIPVAKTKPEYPIVRNARDWKHEQEAGPL
jgi:hypothetical protein